ncbi:Carboxypeptidase A6 [Trichinella zimbabwensis]|uniref:Carboxypeptidase A6 n=1 Tax=Trichinella zimbabwensis TaxID=268475 RepID=A0A0V1HHF9_9BILA|nr:Carboxypeptidase A6 [Trichinella zimbabwensis]
MFAELSLFWTIIFVSIFSAWNLNLYENYQLLQIQLLSQDDVNVLQKIVDVENLEMDFWTPLTDFDNYDKPIIAFVPPTSANLLIENLEKSKISYSNITDVFRKHFNNHVQMLKDKKHKMKTSKLLSTFTLNEYHTLAEVRSLSRKHPQIVKLINIGYSSEGRPLLAVKLAENYENTKEIQSILDKYSFYILPVVNPDGYDYSWKSERFWRKSRSKHNCTFWSCCVGVDLDRNFKISIDLQGHPCRPDYPGPFPFSESETRAVSKFLSENQQHILLAISLHSFGKLLTVPYSFKSDEVENSNFQTYTARHFLQATAFKNKFYTFTQAYNNYKFSIGQEMDWIRLFTNISLAYSIKLPPTPNEPYGFLLPENYIVPVSIQAFEGILNMVKSLNYFY